MTLTPDEWCSRGLDNAILAESAEDVALSVSFLERALYCFRQIGDDELSRKARAHLMGAKMRARVEADGLAGIDAGALEVSVAKTMDLLFGEELYGEALRLVECVKPLLPAYSQEQLTDKVLLRLT